ncbi:MAG: thiolase domain-containing protein [Actinomycetota bacterium]
MRDVAVVSFAQAPSRRRVPEMNEVEILMPVVAEAIEQSGVAREKIGFTCSGSCDYIAGQPFAFVWGLEAIGAWPPIRESHVEMDGAWALYEAWVQLQEGEIDAALVYGFGKSSPGSLRDVLAMQLDPYYLAPMWPDAISLAALQARALLEATSHTEREMADVAARSRSDAKNNPFAQVTGDFDVEQILAEPYLVSPLRKHDCAPISDGAAAVVLAAGDLAREVSDRPAWIRGIDHRIEPHALGARDLTTSVSTATAAEKAGANDDKLDVVELLAPFTHQELILRDAIGLKNGAAINPSGGALAANPVMAAGLIRIGEAAARIASGAADRALAHATSGPCLQQNLVCVLEGE